MWTKYKKLKCAIICCACILFLLGGCVQYDSRTQNVFTAAYPEWIEALDAEYDSAGISCSEICMRYGADITPESIQNFATKIAAHNEFIKSNPEYFSADERFNFNIYHRSTGSGLTALSNISSVEGEPAVWRFDNVEALNEQPDGRAKYIHFEWEDFQYMSKNMYDDTVFDAEILIICVKKYDIDDMGDNLEFLRMFPNARKIVFDIGGDGMSYMEVEPLYEQMHEKFDLYVVGDSNTIWPVEDMIYAK